jgi:hypothetical protein
MYGDLLTPVSYWNYDDLACVSPRDLAGIFHLDRETYFVCANR